MNDSPSCRTDLSSAARVASVVGLAFAGVEAGAAVQHSGLQNIAMTTDATIQIGTNASVLVFDFDSWRGVTYVDLEGGFNVLRGATSIDGTAFYPAAALAAGSNIGPVPPFAAWGNLGSLAIVAVVNNTLTTYTNYLIGAGGGFLGLSFDPGDGTHYAWVQVSNVQWDGSNISLTVVDWAYEDSPGVAIAAGSGTGGGGSPGGGGPGGAAGTPEPAAAGLGLLALGAAGVMRHKRRRKGPAA